MTEEKLREVLEYTLWGMGPSPIYRDLHDPESVIDNLIWRLTAIRRLIENEIGPARTVRSQ